MALTRKFLVRLSTRKFLVGSMLFYYSIGAFMHTRNMWKQIHVLGVFSIVFQVPFASESCAGRVPILEE